tara:strand:+ start:790 stop:1212 length:423 start_codon:yes stop_codon:yes gene_type:complete
MARPFEEFFAGYREDPLEYLEQTFEESEGYNEMVVVRDIRIESYGEHHLAPILAKVHIGYIPERRVPSISKLTGFAKAYAKRLQIREKLTAQITNYIEEVLRPKGVVMVTNLKLGAFRGSSYTWREFLYFIGKISPGAST